MKRFLSVLIASMFLASAAIAAEKMDKTGEEKKVPATTEGKGDAKDAKKAAKGDKKAAAKDDKAATTEKGEKMKDEKKATK